MTLELFAVLALCAASAACSSGTPGPGQDSGTPSDSGTGSGNDGGNTPDSGVASDAGNPGTCQSRCVAKVVACGGTASQANSACCRLCVSSPTEAQLQCLEQSNCAALAGSVCGITPGTCGSCQLASAACSVASPCCSGLTCLNGTCSTSSTCGASGANCSGSAPCCGGLTCTGGSCTPTSTCGSNGAACNASSPCCSGLTCTGGFCATASSCAIPASGLKVSFPYVTLTPPTVIKLSGTCITNGVVTGYGYAAVLNILEERYAALTIQNPGGVAYFYFDVPLGQRAPTSSEVSALANTTGIPSSEVGRSSMTLRSDTNASPTAVTYVLPAGVGMSYFLGTSTSQAGYVRFTASSQPPLDQVVTGLGSGIQVDMPILQQSGSDAYTYRVTLNSASPQVTVTTVTVR